MFTLKKVILSASLALTVSSVAFAQAPQTQIQKESYSMGATLGNVIAGQVYRQTELGAEVDMAAVVQGFNDALKGKTELSDDDMLKILNVRAEQLNKLEEAHLEKVAKANSEKSKAYLAENAKKKGVVTTKSGLQYEVLTEGKGDKPRVEDVVTVNYVGSFLADEGTGPLCDDVRDSGPRRRRRPHDPGLPLPLHGSGRACLRS